jgi:hypothetical protein
MESSAHPFIFAGLHLAAIGISAALTAVSVGFAPNNSTQKSTVRCCWSSGVVGRPVLLVSCAYCCLGWLRTKQLDTEIDCPVLLVGPVLLVVRCCWSSGVVGRHCPVLLVVRCCWSGVVARRTQRATQW